ncbi:MAG TPA: hypothetical protein VLF40_03980 [Candidatus Saccharimonadales bacterium]|nr:hypothetical protein [Candidatus Saccharimonadales bacterium]
MEFDPNPELQNRFEAPPPLPTDTAKPTVEIPASEAYEDELDRQAAAREEAAARQPAEPPRPAPADRPETTKPADAPQPNQEAADHQKAGEHQEEPGMRQVNLLAKFSGDEDSAQIASGASPNKVSAAARNGEDQRLEITRTTAGGPNIFHATDSLVPQYAENSEVPRSAEPAAAPQFKAYARINGVRLAPAPEASGQPAQPNGPTASLNLVPFLAQYSDAYHIVMEGESVSSDMQSRIGASLSNAASIAAGTASMQKLTGKLGALKSELDIGADAGMVRRSLVIGVEDPADLDKVARLFAATGTTSDKSTTWTPELDSRQRVQCFDTAEDALRACERDPDAYVSATKFSSEVKYPRIPVPGLGMKPYETFAAGRTIRDGIATIPVGEILDNNGEAAGELHVSDLELKRGGIIAASSGSGKTVLIRQLVSGAIKEDYERSQAEGNPDAGRAVVIVDFEKFGNYDEKLSSQITGLGVPAERANINRICPGDDGVRANINLLRLTGNTPLEQISIALKALSGNIHDPEAVRVFQKFARAAMELAHEKVGWDMELGKPRIRGSSPPTPDMDMVAVAIKEVLSSTEFAKDMKGNLGSFTETTLREALSGIPGQLFQGGYDIDWEAVINGKGVTVIELGKITDPTAKRVAMTAIFRGLAAALEADKVKKGIRGDIDETKLMLVMDETGGIFNKHTETGRDNGHFFTRVRGLGQSTIIAQQGDLETIDTNVLDNTENMWALKMNSPADRKFVAERMGIPLPQFLGSATEGKGLYQGSNMPDGPVRFQTTNPTQIAHGEHHVAGPEAVIDQGVDPEFYDDDIKVAAKSFLRKDELGNMVRGVAELNTILTVTGHEIGAISGDMLAKLQAREGEDAKIRDCAIVKAVTLAVFSRPELMNAVHPHTHVRLDPRALVKFLSADLLAQVHGTDRPTKGMFDLQLPLGYYTPIKDRLVAETTAPRHPDTPKFRVSFGQRISGNTGAEQLDRLKTVMTDDATKVVVDAVTNPDLDEAALKAAVTNVKRLVGYKPPEEVRQVMQDAVEAATRRDSLTPAEAANLDKVLRNYTVQATPETLGYPDMIEALTRSIEAHKHRPAIDLSDFKKDYGEHFPDNLERPGDLARHQQKAVENAEKARTTTLSYTITMSDILFAPDLLAGGDTVDNVVANLVKSSAVIQGRIFDRQRRAHNAGQDPDYSLVTLYQRGDNDTAKLWGDQAGQRLLMGGDITIPLPGTIFLRDLFADHIYSLETEGIKLKALQMANAAIARAGARAGA